MGQAFRSGGSGSRVRVCPECRGSPLRPAASESSGAQPIGERRAASLAAVVLVVLRLASVQIAAAANPRP